jgi:hypothetical protein
MIDKNFINSMWKKKVEEVKMLSNNIKLLMNLYLTLISVV